METNREKLVQFENRCKSCKHVKESATEDPCDECLSNPTNTDSHKPVRWEEGKK